MKVIEQTLPVCLNAYLKLEQKSGERQRERERELVPIDFLASFGNVLHWVAVGGNNYQEEVGDLNYLITIAKRHSNNN